MDIESIGAFVRGCPLLDPQAPIYSDHTDDSPVNYGIGFSPPVLAEVNILGRRTYRQAFPIHPVLGTATDDSRADNLRQVFGIYKWINEQAKQGKYPAPGEGERIVGMEAESPLRVEDYEGPANTGLYQCQLIIIYEEDN